MTTFLETVRKSDGERRYYVGGCRVRRGTFETVGDGCRACLVTVDAGSHWRHYHERRL